MNEALYLKTALASVDVQYGHIVFSDGGSNAPKRLSAAPKRVPQHQWSTQPSPLRNQHDFTSPMCTHTGFTFKPNVEYHGLIRRVIHRYPHPQVRYEKSDEMLTGLVKRKYARFHLRQPHRTLKVGEGVDSPMLGAEMVR